MLTCMTYEVRLHLDCDDGYAVWVPGLPGCWSQGATEEEALANVRDAIREYLAAADELGADGQAPSVAAVSHCI
jgi:predicted RNase H-like HicB family nuclease